MDYHDITGLSCKQYLRVKFLHRYCGTYCMMELKLVKLTKVKLVAYEGDVIVIIAKHIEHFISCLIPLSCKTADGWTWSICN